MSMRVGCRKLPCPQKFNKGEIMSLEILAKDSKGEITDWEEVPDEDLWEAGELSTEYVRYKIFRMVRAGKYKLIREKS